jgi:hypothetical protein
MKDPRDYDLDTLVGLRADVLSMKPVGQLLSGLTAFDTVIALIETRMAQAAVPFDGEDGGDE